MDSAMSSYKKPSKPCPSSNIPISLNRFLNSSKALLSENARSAKIDIAIYSSSGIKSILPYLE